jgi:hypothetical protein
MTSSLLFKISSGLLFLFSLIHLYGIFKPPVQGAAAELVSSVMRTIHFDIMGSRRNYWDFYFGFGLLLTVFHLFSAVLAWQFSGLDRQALKQVRVAAWGLAVSYAAVAILERDSSVSSDLCSAGFSPGLIIRPWRKLWRYLKKEWSRWRAQRVWWAARSFAG